MRFEASTAARAPDGDAPCAWPAYCIFFLAALVLRWLAARGDLWLDEIWSLELVGEIDSPLAVFTGIHHDNNHYLNSLWLYFAGGGREAWVYRLPAVIAGALAVPVAGRIAHRWGSFSERAAMLLVAASFLPVQYSSEARGYGGLLLFSLLSLLALMRYTERPSPARGLAFAAAAVLGMLSHLLFLHIYLAAAYWSYAEAAGRREGIRGTLRHLAWLHALPVAAGAALYLVDIRHVALGGGPAGSRIDILRQTAALAAGGPTEGWAAAAIAVAFAAAMLWAVWRMRRDGRGEWKFFAFMMIAFPVARVLLFPPSLLFVRYFLLVIICSLLATAYLLGRLRDAGRLGRVCAAAALVLLAAGSLSYILPLVTTGRGHYSTALADMAAASDGDVITVSSDHDHRNGLVIDYYAGRLPPGKRVVYCPIESWPAEPPEWMLVHRFVTFPEPPPVDYLDDVGHPLERLVVWGHEYRLFRSYAASALSGWQWICYRRN